MAGGVRLGWPEAAGAAYAVLPACLSQALHTSSESWLQAAWRRCGPQGPMVRGHRACAGCPPQGEPLACTGAACLWLRRASWLDRWVGWFRRRPQPCPLVRCSPDVVHPGLTQAARGPQASRTAVCRRLLPRPVCLPEDGPWPARPVPVAGAPARAGWRAPSSPEAEDGDAAWDLRQALTAPAHRASRPRHTRSGP